jgi:hypothetical protein
MISSKINLTLNIFDWGRARGRVTKTSRLFFGKERIRKHHKIHNIYATVAKSLLTVKLVISTLK